MKSECSREPENRATAQGENGETRAGRSGNAYPVCLTLHSASIVMHMSCGSSYLQIGKIYSKYISPDGRYCASKTGAQPLDNLPFSPIFSMYLLLCAIITGTFLIIHALHFAA